MKRIADSIYVHLTLVLLFALGASFATMYLIFVSHLEETKNSHFAHSLVAQVRLVEEVLRHRSATDFPNIEGIQIATQPPPPWMDSNTQSEQRLMFLKHRLVEQLHRDVEIGRSTDARLGLWINLPNGDGRAQWVFIPASDRITPARTTLEEVLLVGFAVFFVGGMGLLWRIQRPLKHLSKALEMVGQSQQLMPLPVTGASEISTLTQRYNEMVDRLQRYEEDRATMLAGVAHDLRSPITRLRLLMALVQHPRNDEIIHNLDDIEHITEQFLDYARGQNDEPVIQVDLGVFIEEISAPYASQGVSTECPHQTITAPVRANSLRRALVNLIENSIEYGRPPIVVRLSRNDTHVTIAIEDSGDGIKDELIQQAIRPFSRLDPSRGGTRHCGLGLIIASKIVEQHQGTLQLSNRATGGFVAAIHLPLRTTLRPSRS